MTVNIVRVNEQSFKLCFLDLSQSLKKVAVMWREAELSWKDFLPEDEDANKFVTEKVGEKSIFIHH